MSALARLTMVDLRARLPRASWNIGKRQTAPLSLTLHYNGPPVADRSRAGELAQLVADARWQMRPGWGGSWRGGDGLQYHFAVLSDGTIGQTRDLAAELWHCANETGNESSLAIHLPLGGAQDATAAQWAAFCALADALIVDFDLGGRSRRAVLGHREWPRLDGKPQSACPGPVLMRRLDVWRVGNPGELRYRVRAGIDFAAVREAPRVRAPIALQGTAKLGPGTVVLTDELRLGWVHLSRENPAGGALGFVHVSCLEAV